jgi:N6-adenosine-specific RNA methylase IME4
MSTSIVPAGTGELSRLAEEIRWHEGQAEAAEQEAAKHRLAIGERLVRAKKSLVYGTFVAWATGKGEGTLGFGWSHEWVRLHMQFFKEAANNPTRVGLLPGSVGLRGWITDLRGGVGGAAEPQPLEAVSHAFGLPRNDYRIVLADPPWQYESWKGKSKDTSKRRVVEDAYDTMPLDAIKALPVADVCAKDAVLLCWVTMPLLREGLEVMAAWGFEYRTAFLVWGKLNADRSAAVGFGKYTRSNGELCLLGRRGKGVRPVEGVAIPNLLLSQRGAHSRKPAAQYHIIRSVFGPDVPRAELFARHQAVGWDVWGLEAPSAPTMPEPLPALEVVG